MYRYIIAQSTPSTPAISSPSSNVLDWGIAIAVLVYLVKEAIGMFKTKEESESALTTSLIEDLRTGRREMVDGQRQMTERLIQTQERTGSTLREIESCMKELVSAAQQDKRDAAIVLSEVRELQRAAVVQGEQIRALHDRLDKIGVPMHPEKS